MMAIALLLAAALAQQSAAAPPPFPRPAGQRVFERRAAEAPKTRQVPRPGAPPTVQPAPPPTAAAQTAGDRGPTEAQLGVPIYPGAQFLTSYDAGRNQRFYIYGSTAPFVDLVAFYRTVLKQRGDLVFDAPATHQFDVGRFREETMAFPPGVTIKDFQSQISQGYPNPRLGGVPARFPTIIQIVPVTEGP